MPLEHNLLIEAGAGTGKTTRLVKAVLQALFIRQIPLESIVALTFTNKAAGELKERVGTALDDVLKATAIEDLRQEPWWPSPGPAIPLSELQKLAQAASEVLDRANISTIHSFAFALLKRFPLAAGIDPEASIDDKKLRFDELFRQEWPLWLSIELGEKAPRESQWLELLSKMSLSQVEEAARTLADFGVPLDKIRIPEPDPKRFAALQEQARQLVAAHPGKLNADKLARACEEILGWAAHQEWENIAALAEETRNAILCDPGSPKAWPAEELDRLKLLRAAAENLLKCGDRVIAILTEILEPFIRIFRERLLAEGCLTHAALLYLSREVAKNHPAIRNQLKRDTGLILIDEFQDTDPLQAELLLYLAEKPETFAASWEKIQLAPGKLFIVGDPKQSIYRFRGADIAAYERIGRLLVEQNGLQETLEVNYRSQEQIIQVVNQAFERIIIPEREISPPYVAVTPHHRKETAQAVQDVAVWLADAKDEQSVEEAQATEAENIARWIKESVGQVTVYDPRERQRRPLLYRDIALIFRTYSPMDRFIEALRRHDIPFAVESERYFFTTPEVTDFINLLRAADDPSDTLSLIGFLRGPLAAVSDDEILRHKNAGTLEQLEPVQWLRTLTSRLRRQPLAEVLQTILQETWLMELAARSYHGDQTVANILKFRRLLESFAAEGLMTMGLLLNKLEEFFGDDTIEGESPLADENYNAVRLLTVHKAKGLEFPVVFLPSLHSALRAHPAEPCIFDWRSQKLGLCIAGFCNLDKVELDNQTQRREAAEQNRILYVAMTRARERLVLSGGVHLKTTSRQTYLQRLLDSLKQSLETLAEGEIALDHTSVTVRRMDRVTVTEEGSKAVDDQPLMRVDPNHYAKVWHDRAERCISAIGTPLVVTPTHKEAMSHELPAMRQDDGRRSSPVARRSSLLLGTLLHLFLEHWDFNCEKCDMPAKLRLIANSYFATAGMLRTPFPDPRTGELVLEPEDPMHELAQVVAEAQRILADFIGSTAYDEIKESAILGREIPFFYSGSGTIPMMRGTMDILYRLPDGALVIGDYKSGESGQTADHQKQGKAYQEAVERTLGEKAAFKIISLREGTATAITIAG